MKYVITWETGFGYDAGFNVQEHLRTFESEDDKETVHTQIACSLFDFEEQRYKLIKENNLLYQKKVKDLEKIEIGNLYLDPLEMLPVNASFFEKINYEFSILTLDEWFNQNLSKKGERQCIQV